MSENETPLTPPAIAPVVCDAIEKARVDAEIAERRESQRFRHKLGLLLGGTLASIGLVTILGSTYGWLFLEKEFLGETVSNYLNGFFEVFKILIG